MRRTHVVLCCLVLAGCIAPGEEDARGAALAITDADARTLVGVFPSEVGFADLRWIRSAAVYSRGAPVAIEQPTGLPGASNAIDAPAALRFDDTLVVARLTSTSSASTLRVRRARYAGMIGDGSTTTVSVPLGLLASSAVKLERLGSKLLAVFRVGSTLRAVASSDVGATWSAPYLLTTLEVPGHFDLHSDPSGSELTFWLARAWTYGGADHVHLLQLWDPTTTSTPTFQRVTGVPSAFTGLAPLRGVSVVKHESYVYVAYATAKRSEVLRRSLVTGANETRALRIVPTGITSELEGVVLHPSASGWAALFVEQINTPEGVRHFTYGRRSADGLEYPATPSFSYGTTTTYRGTPSLALSPLPMPWVYKVHDSGRPAADVMNIVFVAEGFTRDRGEAFLDASEVGAESFLERMPFHGNADLFNVYAVIEPSVGPIGPSADTLFGTTCAACSSTRNSGLYIKRVLASYETAPLDFTQWQIRDTLELVPMYPGGIIAGVDDMWRPALIHERYHSGVLGVAFQDLEFHPATRPNVTTDGDLCSPGHPWRAWFVCDPLALAPSRRIVLRDAYRIPEQDSPAHYANPPISLHRFPYETSPSSPSFLSALDLLNPALFELYEPTYWEPDWDLRSSTRVYAPLRAGLMYSQSNQAMEFSPVESELIVQSFVTASGASFDANAWRASPGVVIELELRPHYTPSFGLASCGATLPRLSSVDALVEVGTNVYGSCATSAPPCFSVYESEGFALARLSLPSSAYTPGLPLTIRFRERAAGGTDEPLWLPGLQVLNTRGARYAVQPVNDLLADGTRVVDRLRAKTADQCDFPWWDLRPQTSGGDGSFAITLVPH